MLFRHNGIQRESAKRTCGKHAAEQSIAEEEALEKGMESKSRDFVEPGAEVYTRA